VHFSYYVLAAGRGCRAGGPKAWRQHAGRALLAHHVDFLNRHTPSAYVAISIQADWLERCVALDPGIHWVATDPQASPLASLQRLTRSLPLAPWNFVYHVDMPLWTPAPFEALAAACRTTEAEALIPTYEDRGGHPVLLSASVAPALAALDPATDRLDHWLRTRRTERLPLQEPIILENWNEASEE